MKGYTYILECFDGSFYTGSTTDLELRLQQHQNGEGANHTRKHLPVELVYFEEYDRIDTAFEREKQIQGWSRKKKKALINGNLEKLHPLAECQNESHFKNFSFENDAFDCFGSPIRSGIVFGNGFKVRLNLYFKQIYTIVDNFFKILCKNRHSED